MDKSFARLHTLMSEEKIIKSMLQQVRKKYSGLQEEHVSLTLSQGAVLEKLRTLSESRRYELVAAPTLPSTSKAGIVEESEEVLVLENDMYEGIIGEIRNTSQNSKQPQQIFVLDTNLEVYDSDMGEIKTHSSNYHNEINTEYIVSDHEYCEEDLDDPIMLNQVVLDKSQAVVFCDESESD